LPETQEYAVKPNVVAGIGLLVAVVLFAAVFLSAPLLQSAQQKLDAQVAERIDLAQRLLQRYHAQLGRADALLAELRGLDGTGGATVDVDVEDPDALMEAAEEAFQAEYESNWEAYPPRDPNDIGRAAGRPSFGNPAGQIRDGIAGRDRLLNENNALLDEALGKVEEALALSVNSVSGQSDVEANRLKSTIYLQKGLNQHLQSLLRRRAIEPYRRDVVNLAQQAATLESVAGAEQGTEIDANLERLGTQITQQAGELERTRAELATVDDKVARLQKALEQAQTRAAETRAVMETLRSAGPDLTVKDGAQQFAGQYDAAAGLYREALSEAARIEFGKFTNARIDDSGDYLKGTYVPTDGAGELAIEPGLLHFRDQRAVLAVQVEGAQKVLDNLRAEVARLEQVKASRQQAHQQAQSMLADARSAAQETFDSWKRVEAEAEAAEDEAAALFEQAAGAARDAARYAEQRANDARERTRNVSPQSRELSPFEKRAGSAWLAGYIEAQVADALLAAAWIQYDRFRDRTENARVVTAAAAVLQLNEADAAEERQVATDAKAAGMELVTEAVHTLQRAHQATERNWTVTAQAAGVKYLLVLFGQERYIREAIDGYKAATQGRENERAAAPFVGRLGQLQKRH